MPIQLKCKAAADDYWIKHLILDDEIRADGSLNPKALNKFFQAAPKRIHCSHIDSGRLYSLCTDIAEYAEKHAKRNRNPNASFKGVAYKRVDDIRMIPCGNYDVYHTKISGDRAHASLVRFDPFPNFKGKVPFAVQESFANQFAVIRSGTVRMVTFLKNQGS